MHRFTGIVQSVLGGDVLEHRRRLRFDIADMAAAKLAAVGSDFLWCDPVKKIWMYPINGKLFSIPDSVPSLRFLYSDFEESYDPRALIELSRRNINWLAYYPAALYLVFIWLGPRLMRNRPAFDLRGPLKWWNLFLAVFSGIGCLRMVPHMLLLLKHIGFKNSLCAPPIWTYGTGTAGLWTTLFVYSKIFELVDTVFIVLRKKPLNFLHWYHHATVLLYCFDAYVTEQPVGIHFCTMNYTVHAVMYYYYYLAAASKRPPRWGIVVTVMQVAQMIGGVIVCALALRIGLQLPFMTLSTASTGLAPVENGECYVTRSNLIAALLMYSTYFYLFAEFFVKRYILGARGARSKAADSRSSKSKMA